MSNSLNDGLSKPDQLAALGVDASELAALSVTSAKQNIISLGSPSTVGNIVQSHTFIASTGSIGVVQFGTVFTSAPTIVAQAIGGLSAIPAVSAGSAVIYTTTASASGTFIAIGPGTI